MSHLRNTISALALFAFCAPASAEGKSAWRLFVADQDTATVRAIDAASGEVIDSFELTGPSRLYRTESGKTIFAVQGGNDVVSAISSGLAFEDHGDHGDIKIEAPKLTDVSVQGKKPSHFVDHHGKIALFFDGEGVVRILTETAALEGKSETLDVRADAPHHGVAVAYGKHVLLTEPNKEKPDELPIGIQVLSEDGEKVGELNACPDLHGEASSGNILAIACATGLLVVKSGTEGPAIEHIPYPDTLPEGKTTTLIGGKGLQYFLGNYGSNRVVLIDPTEGAEGFRLIELPTRRVHFEVDSVRPKFAYIFTEDGSLHQLDAVGGEIVKSVKLTDPYSMDGHWNDPRPRIAVAGDKIFVTDPLKSRIHVLDAEKFEPVREVAVEGRPFNIVAVGGSGQTHDHD